MILLEETLDAPGDAREVLRYIADFTHLPSWDPSVERVSRLDSEEALVVGARFLVSLKSLGRTIDVDYRLAELSDCVATLVGRSAGVSAIDLIRVAQVGSRVDIKYRAEISLLGLLRPAEPLMRGRIQAGGKAAIQNLSSVLRHRAGARRSAEAVPVAVG
ncbi:MAG: SRPBCC family protein [Myxococcales bacterium]|nr:SRPBCC family protein [Myxococcales bacterium]